ncbi:MAG: L,D-transpeptidase [Pseudoflavonifractor sp.]|nr:L,D-transpeptidase [Pseudoflavonifractor sp.]
MKPTLSITCRIAAIVATAAIIGSCGHPAPTASHDGGIVADTIGSEAVTTDTTVTRASDSARAYQKFNDAAEARRYMDSSPDSARYAAGILHAMADDWLPYAEKLINSTYPRFIIVDKWAMKVRVFDRYGRMEREYGMACAKNFGTKHKRADSRTPEGFFSVEGVYDSTDWLFTDDDGVTSEKKGQFGPRFIRLRIPGTSQIGIHGTCAPWSIGGRVSHGCIRIKNENILELVTLVEKGMPVIVNPGKRDTRTNIEEGYDIPWISSSHDPRYTRPRVIPRPDSTVTEPTATAHCHADSIAGPSDPIMTDSIDSGD